MTLSIAVITIALINFATAIFASQIPHQVHIALAGNDGSGNSNKMAVSWQTEDDSATSVVKYGLASKSYTMSSTGKSSSYYEVSYQSIYLLNDL